MHGGHKLDKWYKAKSCLIHMQVKGVMRQNIEKVAQRGEKLEDLGERAGEGQEVFHCADINAY